MIIDQVKRDDTLRDIIFFFAQIKYIRIYSATLRLLPNLTEDVGFFASFWPLYAYEYRGPTVKRKSSKTKKKSNGNQTDQNTDGENEG